MYSLGEEAWIQTHFLECIAMLGLYILFSESMGCNNSLNHIRPDLRGRSDTVRISTFNMLKIRLLLLVTKGTTFNSTILLLLALLSLKIKIMYTFQLKSSKSKVK